MNKDRLSLMTFPFGIDEAMRAVDTADIFKVTASCGIRQLDIRSQNRKKTEEYLACCKKTGISINCYIAYISFFRNRKEVTDDLNNHLQTAHSMGARYFMIVPFSRPGDFKIARKIGKERTRDRMIQGFRLSVKQASEYKMKVCFETTPHETFALSGADDCAYVLSRVPGLGLVFDTANMLPHGDVTLEAYEKLKQWICYVHLKDVSLEKPGRLSKDSRDSMMRECASDGRVMKRVAWGKGVIPVKEVAERMLSDGYSGDFAIEYARPEHKIRCGVKEHAAQLQRFIQYLE